jgi:hypothetical protein
MTDSEQTAIRWRAGVLSLRLGLRVCAAAAVSRAGTRLLQLSALTAQWPVIAGLSKSGAGRCYSACATMKGQI